VDDYTLIRSPRKTVAIRVLEDESVVVRAPQYLSRSCIDAVVAKHGRWIEKQRERHRNHAERFPEPTAVEREELIRRAKSVIPPMVERYAALMGVKPAGLSITSARTRFGSCSGKNRLSFSWRLMRYPIATIEAVVVHELCHIVHKNHQKEFYILLRSILPDYDERTGIL